MQNDRAVRAALGDLELLDELGRGAYATVYRARDRTLQRVVALKVLRPSALGHAAGERERLLAEARLVARLQSPHIVTLFRVHDLGPEGLALELEHMEGGSLAALLERERRLDEATALRHARALLSALEEAHAQGIVHRDVKAANVLLTGRGQAKLADFGLGRLSGEASLSGEGGRRLAGTPQYMAPEVVMGEPATPRSDLWSAGVLLYRMLAGRLPFDATELLPLFHQILNEDPEPLGPEVRPALAALVMRCLARAPQERPPSAAALLHELGGAAGGAPAPALGAALPAGGTRLVGREREAARLAEALEGTPQGRGGALLLLGDEGLGKSALLGLARERAQAAGLRWIDVALTPLGGLQRPLLGAVRALMLGESRGEGLTGLVTAQRFGPAAPLLRGLLAEDAYDLQSTPQVLWATEHLLRGLGRERAAVLALDDLQHAGEDDLRLLGELASRLVGAPVLLLMAGRERAAGPDAPAASDGGAWTALRAAPAVTTLALGPLTDDAISRVLHGALPGCRLAADVLARLVTLSEGNPLVAQEALRHLLDTQGAVRDGDRVVRGPAWERADLPHRLRDLLALRVGGLDDEQRTLLDAAAVDGTAFHGEALARVLGLPLLQVLRGLQRLHRTRGLVLPQKRGYRFRTAVLREVLYEDLAPDLRRLLHHGLAEALSAEGAEADDPERVGQHWERAGETERAAPLLRVAALRSARRQQYHAALDLAARGGLLGERADPALLRAECDLVFALAGCLSDLGRRPEADTLLERLTRAAAAPEHGALRLRARVWQCDLAFWADGAARVDADALERAVAELPPSSERSRALYLRGLVQQTRGDLAAAAASLAEAEAAFAASGPATMAPTLQHARGSVARAQGDLDAAERLFAQAATGSLALGRRVNAAVSSIFQVLAAVDRGRLEGADARLEEAVRLLADSGAEDRSAHAAVYLARVYAAQGRWEEAERALDGALAVLERSTLAFGRLEVLLELAQLHLALGRADSARRYAAAAERLAREVDDADARLLLGALAAKHAGAFEEADAWRAALAAGAAAVASVREPERRVEPALLLAEAALLTGRPEAAEGLAALDADALPRTAPLTPAARALLAAARAPSAKDAAGAVEGLAAQPPGWRRAELALLVQALRLRGGRVPAPERDGWERAVRARAHLRSAAGLPRS